MKTSLWEAVGACPIMTMKRNGKKRDVGPRTARRRKRTRKVQEEVRKVREEIRG